MGDSAKAKELLQELLYKEESGACLDDEPKTDVTLLQHACLEKEKGKMVYFLDDKEVDNLDVNHSTGRCE
ncbi:hypothetical protein KI387_044383, partial [Taxus chinensis]